MGGGLGGECEDVVLGKGASWKVLVPIARASITWIVHMPRRLRVGCRFARKRFDMVFAQLSLCRNSYSGIIGTGRVCCC